MHTLRAVGNKLIWTAWNGDETRLRAVLRIALQAAVLAFVTILAQGIVGVEQDETLPLAFSIRLVTVLLSTWIAGRLIDRRKFSEFGLEIDPHWWTDLLFGLLLGGVLMTLVFVTEFSMGWITVRERFAVTVDEATFGAAIIGPLVVFVAVGISEEILTRGYQMRNMAEGANLGGRHAMGALLFAWLLSSVMFGLYHMRNPNATWVSTTNLVLAGLFLGLGLLLTGRLGLPIGLHITWNFFQGNVFGFPVSGNDYAGATFIAIQQGGPDLWTGGAFGPEAGLIGIGAIIVGSLLIVLWARLRYGRVALYEAYAVYSPVRDKVADSRDRWPTPRPDEYITEEAEQTDA